MSTSNNDQPRHCVAASFHGGPLNGHPQILPDPPPQILYHGELIELTVSLRGAIRWNRHEYRLNGYLPTGRECEYIYVGFDELP